MTSKDSKKKKTWKITSKWNANCCNSAARSLLWSVSRGCNDATSASRGHRKSAVARIARLAGAKLELERRFVHIGGEYASGEYTNGNERSLVWREIDAAFESRILTIAVINSNHIEPRQFLKDAGNVL